MQITIKIDDNNNYIIEESEDLTLIKDDIINIIRIVSNLKTID